MKTKELTLTGIMAALIALCAWLTIPTTVPFTMQTFAIFLAVGLLGGRLGSLAVGVYLLLGVVGLPGIFRVSGRSWRLRRGHWRLFDRLFADGPGDVAGGTAVWSGHGGVSPLRDCCPGGVLLFRHSVVPAALHQHQRPHQPVDGTVELRDPLPHPRRHQAGPGAAAAAAAAERAKIVTGHIPALCPI